VIGIVGNALGLDDETRADVRSASPRAFRRGFAEANSLRISPEEIDAPCPTLLVAGEGEMKPPVRASTAALAALMGNAEARYVPGHGHGWIGEEPDLHRQMVTAWITGGDLPSELSPRPSHRT
jgi:pimeloyl-ACP methyl ester carboxylesterase